MKKSEIKPDEILTDLNNAVNLINQIESINLEKNDLKQLKENAEKLNKDLKEKYKDIIEESKEDLDSEE
tara:strand:- start:3686 stop:3892 length:207 start_codon:yes stop_codon:yes gene_type:complete